MHKSCFLLALAYVVEKVRDCKTSTTGECWKNAVEIGIRAGFPITANDEIIKNKILEAVMHLSGEMSVVHTSIQALQVQAWVEAAWEYYQAKVAE